MANAGGAKSMEKLSSGLRINRAGNDAVGALNETHAILQRMRELSVQSSTDTNTDTGNLQDEIR